MSTRDHRPAEWHVLDFYCDKNGDCSLTVITRGVRFHIIVDADRLGSDTEAMIKYRSLVRALESADSNEKSQTEDESDIDSGVDVSHNPKPGLHEWIFAPLASNLDDLVPPSKSVIQNLQEWYHCPSTFWQLVVHEGSQEIEAVELESSTELETKVQGLLPGMTLPKYITSKVKVPWFVATELNVLDASDKPTGTPYHPCRVQHKETKDIYFLKVVDNDQPGSVKRELDTLRRIQASKLGDQLRAPSLLGLVMFDGQETTTGKRQLMGFLLTDIPDPKPLTTMFDESIPQTKREGWAEEADRMKEALHQHKIIWGDAKADNFLVDKDDKLWIIDFGGSYTEGWIDPELNETEDGDNMGVEKIVNALEDPVNNVQHYDDDDEKKEADVTRDAAPVKRKREKRSHDGDGDIQSHLAKRTRTRKDE